ncbi:U32 family peptidase [Sedimentibacter sp. zth1]|uniref:U32 family peptidase n=1 Tax=Sedimentibacter sp. zth1 TaxID=2816908 RepID=UPI001A9153CD|nr:U32 family peptidase [Sedimentibacter sp. zth1]QSX07106.1 U32 family peptidase [Sedimentibacter sp. zth1]
MIKKIELLAPAGNKDAFYAAINSGADAVYLGGKNFNARQYSDNFENEELVELVKYAHNKNVKVYVTVNIILKDTEIIDALNYTRFLYEIDVDAVIVQDLGLIYLIKKYIPNLNINVSTQATVYDKYGIEFFNNIEINRFILSRELSLNEIKEIANSTDKKIETFIHGALCMCYSGQCYLSSYFGGRSGNRGKCAQPCRLNYSFFNNTNKSTIEEFDEKPLLSLKDFKAGLSVTDLIDIGVTTLKIEGRMKNPEYTAIVVEYYRHLIDNYINGENYDLLELENKVESVFSRGFTNGYLLNGKEDMFAGVSSGSKGKDIDNIVDEIQDRINPYSKHRRRNIDLSIEVCLGQKIKLTAKDDYNEVVVFSSEIVEQSIKNPVNEEMLKEQLYKLGNTIFNLNSLLIKLDENTFARKSTINELRREAVDKLYDLHSNSFNRQKIDSFTKNEILIPQSKQLDKSKISFKINSLADLNYISDKIARIYVPYDFNDYDTSKIENIRNTEKFLWIPNIMNNKDYEYLLENIKKLENIYDGVYVNNVGSLYFFKRYSKLKIHCGYFFNIINTFSANYLYESGASSATLSVESNIKDIESINKYSPIQTEIVAYAYVQLMTMKNCPFSVVKGCKSHGNCKSCEYSSGYKLKDRKNITFNIERENGLSKLYNSVPLTTISKTSEFLDIDIDYYFIDSKWAEDIKSVIDVLDKELNEEYVENKEYDILQENSFTRGHYFKNIL